MPMASPAPPSATVAFVGRIASAAGALLGALMAVSAAPPVQAQTVTNVASARWTIGGQEHALQSNEVRFDVVAPAATLRTFTPLPGAATRVQLKADYCAAARTTAAAGAGSQFHDTPLIVSDVIHAGQRLVVSVIAAQANTDPARADELALVLEAPAGEREEIRAVETGADTGVFYAAIATSAVPPAVVAGDCRLSLAGDADIRVAAYLDPAAGPITARKVRVLADPFGVVFDSLTGAPVNGARVTLVDEATGAPAQVFAFDGVTPFPASLVSGQTVRDAAGGTYRLGEGEYVFPLAALGRYRLRVEPPAPFLAPSQVDPARLAGLARPDGGRFQLGPASFGKAFDLLTIDPLQVDIPVDAPGGSISLEKRVSRDRAQPGETLAYTVTLRNRDASRPTREIRLADRSGTALRLRAQSIRIDGALPGEGTVSPAEDGHGFSLNLGPLAPGVGVTVRYVMSVRPDAAAGTALNRVRAVTGDGSEATAEAGVRIERDGLADRMTLIGRVTAGGCGARASARGIAGIRVMLEDGSFAVTDADGRYHFEGLVPGTHIVQAAADTLPDGARFSDCGASTASAGSANSRFVRGQGGSLHRADFHALVPEGAFEAQVPAAATQADDREAAGFDWIAMGDGPNGFLYPGTDSNPRSPAIRVAVRHEIGQSAKLEVGGNPADPLSFEGTEKDPAGRFAVSHWRGIHLKGATTHLTATVRNAGGEMVEGFAQEVHFADTPMQAEVLPERSRLLADGISRPVLAVRLRDRHGRPVHGGISGQFTLDGPYQSASALDARQSRVLTGFGNVSASWLVEGDEGIAMIELAPTMVSGAFRVRFAFSDGETSREQEVEAWIEPGEMPWTLIGLAEGGFGARSIADAMERTGDFDSDLGEDARVVFFAKGRVLGKFLLTLAYDSARQEADHRLLGTIDPSAYYTVFGDGSERLYDAASREKLYVRVESKAFYALYGDFETGFDQTRLARYQRSATGVKAEARIGGARASGFATHTATRHRRDEIQGSGLTGPYRLSSRQLVPNSEQVAIEVRDRLRAEVIVARRELVRFVDYDIDLLSGTLTFAEPVASRDSALNPQFILVDFEVDELDGGAGEWNAGLRASWTSADGALRLGATGITDKGDGERANLGAADMRLRLGPSTEIRAEIALSGESGASAAALSAEAEHRTGALDLVAYARQLDADFGVGQQNLAERGRRKLGVDARWSLGEAVSLVGSGWQEESLTDTARRRAAEVRGVLRAPERDLYLGLSYLDDRRADGSSTRSTVVEAGGHSVCSATASSSMPTRASPWAKRGRSTFPAATGSGCAMRSRRTSGHWRPTRLRKARSSTAVPCAGGSNSRHGAEAAW